MDDNRKEIEKLVCKRVIARADRDYDEADSIRDDLRSRFDVITKDIYNKWFVKGGGSEDWEIPEVGVAEKVLNGETELGPARGGGGGNGNGRGDYGDRGRSPPRYDRDRDYHNNGGRDYRSRSRDRDRGRDGYDDDRGRSLSRSPGRNGGDDRDQDEIQVLLEKREIYRYRREFDKADPIRDEMRHRGVILMDADFRWESRDGRMGGFIAQARDLEHKYPDL